MIVSKTFKNVGSLARNCDDRILHYDQACVEINSNASYNFYMQYLECENCELENLKNIDQFVVKTLWPIKYNITDEQNKEICNGTYQFGEYGHYTINITSEDACKVVMTAEPDAAYLPILETAVTLLALATLWYLVKGIGKRILVSPYYLRYFGSEDNELGSESRVLTSESRPPRSPTRSRLRSLDVFRGAAVAMMIFVNQGGGGYAVFSHSVWNGLTVADIVFPCFAWIMGASMVLSLNARLRTSMTRTAALGQVARRSLVLALMGIVLDAYNVDWHTIRLPGVLQRLAIMYLIVASIECLCMKTNRMDTGASLVRDLSAGWMQWLVTLVLVAVHVCVSLLVAAPGCPRGYIGPGGVHMTALGVNYTNCTGGIAGYIDRKVLGEAHLYSHGTFKELYHTTVRYDPEGLLGILSGVLVVQGGAHAARIMLHYRHARARIMRWLLWWLVWCLMAGALCQFQTNAPVIPINKNLWSLSYCLAAGGIAFLIQAVLYFGVDLKAKWGGRPLYYAGQNALIIYIGSVLLRRHFPFYWPIASPTHAQLLATHAFTTLIWLAVAIALHRNRIFISV